MVVVRAEVTGVKLLPPAPAAVCRDVSGWPFGSVGFLVPWVERFEAFTRLFHPVQRLSTGRELQWRELAAESGSVWHPEVQFESIATSQDHSEAWLGDLGQKRLATVVQLLALSAELPCTFALWDGGNWISERPTDVPSEVGVDRRAWDCAPELSGAEHRRYKLLSGTIEDLPNLGNAVAGVWFHRQPTLAWAVDLSFCIATDPDYDSTVIATDRRAQERILRSADLEAVQICVDSSLLLDADRINNLA